MKTHHKILAILLVSMFLFSLSACKEQTNPEVTQLQQTQQELAQKIIQKNTRIEELSQYLTGLETELDLLLEGYQINDQSQTDNSSHTDRLTAIREMISTYQDQLDELQTDVKKKSASLVNLTNSIASLEQDLSTKESEINDLVSEIFDLTTELTFTRQAADQALVENEKMTQEMNTVYIATGSFKELEAQGIAQKKGGFLGIGGQKMLSPQLQQDKFIPADKRQLRMIPIDGNQVEILSVHPIASYELKSEENKAHIEIKDPDQFWSTTSFLAIATK